MSQTNTKSIGRPRDAWLWVAVVIMIVLHQDFWFWSDSTLVFGFMPVGLLYHAGYSLVAAVLWLAAVKFAWPAHIEAWADEFDDQATKPESNAAGGRD